MNETTTPRAPETPARPDLAEYADPVRAAQMIINGNGW